MEEHTGSDDELLPDSGLIARIQAQVDNMPDWVKSHTELASETVANLGFKPVEALKRFLEVARLHKKGIAQLGALGTLGAGVGVTAAALIPTHRR